MWLHSPLIVFTMNTIYFISYILWENLYSDLDLEVEVAEIRNHLRFLVDTAMISIWNSSIALFSSNQWQGEDNTLSASYGSGVKSKRKTLWVASLLQGPLSCGTVTEDLYFYLRTNCSMTYLCLPLLHSQMIMYIKIDITTADQWRVMVISACHAPLDFCYLASTEQRQRVGDISVQAGWPLPLFQRSSQKLRKNKTLQQLKKVRFLQPLFFLCWILRHAEIFPSCDTYRPEEDCSKVI